MNNETERALNELEASASRALKAGQSLESALKIFIIVVVFCAAIALMALYIDVKKIELSLGYDTIKLLFANCFLLMVHLIFVDNIKSMKIFGYLVSGFFVSLGSYLIWAS